MEIIRKALSLEKTEYYEMHLSIVNCLLPVKMTPMEIKVMAAFMSIEGELEPYRFDVIGRRMVRKQLNLTPQSLSNHERELIKKEFLIRNEKDTSTSIYPLLLPERNKQEYQFKIYRTNEKPIENNQAAEVEERSRETAVN